jgi:hypothetical protein
LAAALRCAGVRLRAVVERLRVEVERVPVEFDRLRVVVVRREPLFLLWVAIEAIPSSAWYVRLSNDITSKELTVSIAANRRS